MLMKLLVMMLFGGGGGVDEKVQVEWGSRTYSRQPALQITAQLQALLSRVLRNFNSLGNVTCAQQQV